MLPTEAQGGSGAAAERAAERVRNATRALLADLTMIGSQTRQRTTRINRASPSSQTDDCILSLGGGAVVVELSVAVLHDGLLMVA